MGRKEKRSCEGFDLRRQAEKAANEKAVQSSENLENLSPDEIKRTLHELRVHQIELEMQNEELRRTQAELDAARERYFDLYNFAPVGYFIISEKGLILETNLTASNLLGVARGALVKQPISRFIHKESQDIFYHHRNKLFNTGEPQACELRIKKKDGMVFWGFLETAVAQDTNGQPVCRIAMSDITERKKLEENVARLRQEYETFMRHELKNLLIPLSLYSELLLLVDQAALSEEQVSFLQKIRESSAHAIRFIDSLKRFQDIEIGEHTLQKRICNVENIIALVVSELQSFADSNGVTVRFTSECPNETAFLDVDLLPGVFSNLIINAVQHVSDLADPAEKVVTVDLSRKGNDMVTRINNRGEPVSPERLSTFFEKFNTVRTQRFGGTGLGTTYALLVANAHGGDITVTSNAEKGTTVMVSIPKG